ncbi:hypothetical protein PIB30_061579 [Stylosanthes scabra]|uniref:Protein JASON n=1 Tax=Stylosanthes scabra TaxID=79078 RepID=A0ABU6ZJL1_9FABA|nr:hypothetical protein [Stylosanthes scabra]
MRLLGLILRFVFRSFSRATMGCFFACFGSRENRHLPTTAATTPTTAVLSPQSKTNDAVVSRNQLSILFQSEVREESACNEGSFGTGSQIHDKGLKDEAMFLEASEKPKASPSHAKDSEPSRFHSRRPNTSTDKFWLDNQSFNPPTPKRYFEDCGKRTDSLEQTPSSCISNAQNNRRDSVDSSEGSKTGSLYTSRTPGTVFETAQSQFGYPKQAESEKLKKVSNENESKVDESLSSWLKPASVILEERNKRMEMGRKTPADRPIIGMVAAHWNEDEESDVPPPKWWDGNGIPNSTNKYKEDQKVSWHATPFEERLEKALSEQSSITQRKDLCGKPIAFNENEENDTAISQFQSSQHPQSVVSF